jgi:hypothetical protein
MSGIEAIFTLRNRRLSYTQIAEQLRLPRHVVELTVRHERLVRFRRNVEAVEIPGTGDSIWKCPGCGALLECVPCVRCGGEAPRPEYRRRRQEVIDPQPTMREYRIRDLRGIVAEART